MQREFSSFIQEFKTLKTDMTALRTSVIGNKKAIIACEARMDRIEAMMADLENRNLRNNLCLIGLKEGDEGSNPIDFLSKTLPLCFPTLSGKTIEIMRAHRIYSDQSKSRDRPRTLIFKLLRYSHRQAVLQAARKNASQSTAGNIRVYPDYKNIMAQCHRALSHPITFARSRGLQALLLYPATLKIHHGSTDHLFLHLSCDIFIWIR
ncbi:UNVERIFIED_CONTAM: hypothetical protein FKN15_063880 [Acipenser sinensis]